VVAGIMIALLFAGYQRPLVSAQQPINVAVLDFGTGSITQTSYAGTVSRYAADDLAAQLAHVSNVTVISRKSVRDAAASMGWKTADLVSFDRLAQLAQNVGANYLFVGRVQSINVPGGGGGAGLTATVQIALFDAAAKSNLGTATGNGLAATTGGRDAAVRGALHNANAKALAPLKAKLPH
jgi:hypothetical protein